ncbi:putative DUF1104 domain protein [Campylobacter showae]|uniref:DUF1104 domain-containing protein n=1 Tax=Campylobacter showae RM3277 TaxID=553219 RepID=C6RDH6_9BACT|nr:DUF1104 domain-containing protein [Campylobacter showae]EET80537.1 hypothetical protein CAMSH0001_0007 [Campylobacter showae RM3277]QCD49250.1 putative DUF1104 domain protein [Campylobacter showae]
MKKVVLISMLVAGGLFAASLENSTNDELYKMVANADAKTLSEVAFEIDKRAGKLKFEAKEAKRGLKTEIRKKFEAMSIADRERFMREFRNGYNAQVGALSVAEAKKLDIELKDGDDDDDFHKKFKHDFKGGFKHGGKGMMAQDCANARDCNQTDGYKGPKQPMK